MKIKSYLLAAIFALVLVSCSKEEEPDYNVNQNRIDLSQSQSAGGGMDELTDVDMDNAAGGCVSTAWVMGNCNTSGSFGGGVVIGGQAGCNRLQFQGTYVRNANNTVSLPNLTLSVGPTNTITVANKTVFYNSQTDEVWINVTFKERTTIPSNEAPYYGYTDSYFTKRFILNPCAKTLQ